MTANAGFDDAIEKVSSPVPVFCTAKVAVRATPQPAAPMARPAGKSAAGPGAPRHCAMASTCTSNFTVSATKGRLWVMPKLLRTISPSKSPPHTSRRNSGLK